MNEHMNHCPFCGSTKIKSGEIIIHADGNKLPSVWCDECGARVTAPKGHIDYAIERWNKRILDISFDDLLTLESLLNHDIYSRMKDYVSKYQNFTHVCSNEDVRKYHLRPMLDATRIISAFASLKDALFEEKNGNGEEGAEE